MSRFPGSNEALPPDNEAPWTAGDCPPGRDCRPDTSIQRCRPKGLPGQRESQNRWAEEWAVGHRAGFSERRPSFRFGRSGVEWETRSIDSFRCFPSAVDKTWGPGQGGHCPALTVRCFVDRAFSPNYAICDLRDPTRAPGGARSAPLVSGTNAAGSLRPRSTAVTV
jgi:hypothetical protein